jgi:hypothetical protein
MVLRLHFGIGWKMGYSLREVNTGHDGIRAPRSDRYYGFEGQKGSLGLEDAGPTGYPSPIKRLRNHGETRFSNYA